MGDEEDEYVDSYEDVSIFTLSGDREERLLDEQIECTFMWSTKDGDPVGVIMNYLWRDGKFWLTCTCLLYTSPSPRDGLLSRMPSSA